MAARICGALVGVVFGVTLSWTGLSAPDVIRRGLLFENSYLFLFFASAVLVAFVGLRVLRGLRLRALLSRRPIQWASSRPTRRALGGSVLFGIGWAVADSCPGPIASQLGQGVAWSICTIAGIALGLTLFRRAELRPTGEGPRKREARPRPAAGPA